MRYLSKKNIRRTAASAQLLFAFVPWPEYWIKNQTSLTDQTILKATFETTCSKSGRVYNLSVAMTEPSRRKGLSRRKQPLAPDEGMIFIFEYPQQAAFWMKETLIPLQLVYVQAQGKVLEALEMPVEKNPNNPKNFYRSSGLINAAIELAPKSLKSPKALQFCVSTEGFR